MVYFELDYRKNIVSHFDEKKTMSALHVVLSITNKNANDCGVSPGFCWKGLWVVHNSITANFGSVEYCVTGSGNKTRWILLECVTR